MNIRKPTGPPRILIVTTSHDRIDANHPTGLWLEEFAIPYRSFRAAGCSVTVASIRGGRVPVDPRSLEGDASARWREEQTVLETTPSLAEVTGEFDALFLPGGHGTMFDLPEQPALQGWIRRLFTSGRPVAAVCHGPVGLAGVRLEDGWPLVRGRVVTAFTNAEERAVRLERRMPFLLEDRLREEGAAFSAGALWEPHVEVDDNLVTGQNPASSAPAAKALLQLLR